jgi:GT2 family glycosyltransferase
MSGTPKVAFIIVCWNNQPLLKECFDSIQAQSYNKYVTIMIDNGSSDDSVSFTKNDYPWVDVYEAGANLGFAKGNNIAIAYARQKYPELDYFVLLNTDARLDDNWLEMIIKFADRKPRGAIFQSTTLDYYDHSVIDSTHIYLSRNGSGTQAKWRSLYKGEQGPKKVFGVNAAAAVVSTRFLDAQPFNYVFDEKMFMYLEDVDLCARATVMGWDNYLVPGTFAYHMGSASSGKKPGFSLYMTYRNNMAVLIKNLPLSMLMRMLPAIIRSDRHTVRHLRRTGQGDAVPKLLKGRVVGALRSGIYLADWLKMHKYRKKVDKEYLWQLMRFGD